MTRQILFILLFSGHFYLAQTLKTSGQKTSKDVKYPFSTTIHVDSSKTNIFHTTDYQNYIVSEKNKIDSLAQAIFDNKILFAGLLDIIDGYIYSTPNTTVVSSGQTYYFSIPEGKFLPHRTETCTIKKVTLTNISKKSFILEIQVATDREIECFEFKFHSKEQTKKYPTLKDKLNHAEIISRKNIWSEDILIN